MSLEENVAMISEGTTGLVTWEAALYLAEWALDNTHVFTGRYISLSLSLSATLCPVFLSPPLMLICSHFHARLLYPICSYP